MRRLLALFPLLAACSGDPAYERALAALGAGELARCEEAIGGIHDPAAAAFFRGNVAFARCVEAEKQASTPEAEPFAFDVALQYGRKALAGWTEALLSREADWPEARRNAERALLKLAELEEKKSNAERERRKENAPSPRPVPPPPPVAPAKEKEESATDPALLRTELSEAEVARVLETLARKEREKAALRRAHRRTAPGQEGKDW